MFPGRRKNLPSIRLHGDPCLREVARPVAKIDDSVRELCATMFEVMKMDDGIGLAATQIGVPLRIFTLGVPHVRNDEEDCPGPLSPGEALLLPAMPMAVINPEIISLGQTLQEREEGCLSLPNIYAPVKRPSTVVLKAQTLDGGVFTVECGGLLGRAIQHENDHLDGKLFIDRLEPDALKAVESKIDKLLTQGKKQGFLKSLIGR